MSKSEQDRPEKEIVSVDLQIPEITISLSDEVKAYFDFWENYREAIYNLAGIPRYDDGRVHNRKTEIDQRDNVQHS